MASGFHGGRDYYASRSVGGLLKRSLPAEIQSPRVLLRAVKQRTQQQSSPISTLSPLDRSPIISFAAAGSINPSLPPSFSFPEPEEKTTAMRDQLQELERQLLLDDEEEREASASGSALTTTNEWSETMQQLISPVQNPLSPSPTSSSSSTASSASTTVSASSRQLLLDTASAISDGNLEAAAVNLAQLKQGLNARDDPEQRLTAIMVSALVSRVNPLARGSHHPIAELCRADHLAATALLREISPVFKLGVTAANLAILDATRDHSKIHIVDFDVGQGAQYAAFVHALAEQHRHRPNLRAPALKITAVADPSLPFHAFNPTNSTGSGNNLSQVGERLARFAERAGVGLRFNIVYRRVSELERSTLGCEPGEALAVNFAFLLSRVADESVTPANPRDELLRRVKALSPLVVTLVEQDMNTNTAPFLPRFSETCTYYGALLESLDATSARDSPDRARVQACIARKATNAVAREGAERVDRCEVAGKWRARMGMAGFSPCPLGPAVSEPVRARFNLVRPNPGFTFKEEAGLLYFGWSGRVLTVASAWH